MKAGVFKLNMHPTEFFNRNPFQDDGKGGKGRSAAKERSTSAPSDKRPFKYSSPGKAVSSASEQQPLYLHPFVSLARREQRWLLRQVSQA